MDRLSPEDIKRARFELAELERRFLTRVAQSHRSAKATGKGAKDKGPTGALAAAQQRPLVAPWLLPPHAQPSEAPTVRAGAGAVAIAAPFGLPRDYGQRPVVEPPKPPVPAVDQARAKAALEGLKLPTLPSDASLSSLGLGARPRGGSFASVGEPLPSWPSAKDLKGFETPGGARHVVVAVLLEAHRGLGVVGAAAGARRAAAAGRGRGGGAARRGAREARGARRGRGRREAPARRGRAAPVVGEADARRGPQLERRELPSLVTSGDLPAPAPDLLSMPLSAAVRGDKAKAPAPGAAAARLRLRRPSPPRRARPRRPRRSRPRRSRPRRQARRRRRSRRRRCRPRRPPRRPRLPWLRSLLLRWRRPPLRWPWPPRRRRPLLPRPHHPRGAGASRPLI